MDKVLIPSFLLMISVGQACQAWSGSNKENRVTIGNIYSDGDLHIVGNNGSVFYGSSGSNISYINGYVGRGLVMCNGILSSGSKKPIIISRSGNQSSETVDLGSFDTVDVPQYIAKVELSDTSENSVECDDAFLKHVRFSVKNRKLTAELEEGTVYDTNNFSMCKVCHRFSGNKLHAVNRSNVALFSSVEKHDNVDFLVKGSSCLMVKGVTADGNIKIATEDYGVLEAQGIVAAKGIALSATGSTGSRLLVNDVVSGGSVRMAAKGHGRLDSQNVTADGKITLFSDGSSGCKLSAKGIKSKNSSVEIVTSGDGVLKAQGITAVGDIALSATGSSGSYLSVKDVVSDGSVKMSTKGYGRLDSQNIIAPDGVTLSASGSSGSKISVGNINTSKITLFQSGYAEIFAKKIFARETSNMTLKNNGKISIEDLHTLRHIATISGYSQLAIKGGSVDEQEVKISDSGTYKARYLISKICQMIVSSYGSGLVQVLDRIFGTVRDSGEIKYFGSPINDVKVKDRYGSCKRLG